MVSRKDELEKKTIVKGIGGSQGKAKGVCRLVLNKQQLDKIMVGDIMITQMTTPDMIIAMRKCVAIVTDIGGICCHAAIVSRELGIPCVVGTRDATSRLREESIIEVDGTRGIVTEYQATDNSDVPGSTSLLARGGPVKSRMNRDAPIYPETWGYDWPRVNMDEEYQWITTMPELVNDPIGSIHLTAIEKIPYVFGFGDIGPLYARFYNCLTYIRLDKLEKVMARFKQRIGPDFVKEYRRMLDTSSRDLADITRRIEKSRPRFRTKKTVDLLNLLAEWWRKDDQFLALRYLTLGMADDIVWPRVRQLLADTITEAQVNEYLSILSLPMDETLSMKFLTAASRLMNSSTIAKSIIISNLDETIILRILSSTAEGKRWLRSTRSFGKNWGWVRTRILYDEPMGEVERILKTLKAFSVVSTPLPRIDANHERFEECMDRLKTILPKGAFEELKFQVDFGNFIAKEKDDHYFVFLKQSNVIRDLLLELGKRLRRKERLVPSDRDVFFLFVQEVFELFALGTPRDKKLEIVSKIPNRMNAFTYVSNISLHSHPGYGAEEKPTRDYEYY